VIVYVHGPSLVQYLAQKEDPLVSEGDRDRTHDNVILWLGRYCEVSDCRAVVVFDDLPPDDVRTPVERRGRVRVLNLPHGGDAMREIGGPANRSSAEERTLVVTDDHRLRSALERGAATVLSPGQFVTRARQSMRPEDEMKPDEPDEKFAGLTDEEVQFWLRYFENER